MATESRFAWARTVVVALALASTATALAKTEAKDAAPHLRYAHSCAEAMAEAKDRGCVIFATIHEDG